MGNRSLLLLALSLGVATVGCGSAGSTPPQNPVPALTAVAPEHMDQGIAANLIVTGTGFIATSQVAWNGIAQSTVFVSASELHAAPSADLPAKSGWPRITVVNPAPGGGTSNLVTITVLPQIGVISRLDLAALNPSVPVPDLTPTSAWLHATISDDARFISEDFGNVFLIDACTGTTSACAPSASLISPGLWPSMSADGRYLVYSSKDTSNFPLFNNVVLRDNCLPAIQGCTVSTRNASQEVSTSHYVINASLSGDARAFTAMVTRGDSLAGTSTFAQLYSTGISASPICTKGLSGTVALPTPAPFGPIPISDTGRYVASNGDFGDLCTGVFQNILSGGNPSMSGNGRYVVTTGNSDVHMQGTCAGVTAGCTPSTQLISVADDGSPMGGLFGLASDDGSTVAFSIGDTTGTNPSLPMEVFVRTTCVGQTSSCTPHATKVSVGLDGSQGNCKSLLLSLTRDGRYVLFASTSSNFVMGDTNNSTDLFLARTGVPLK